MKIKIENLGVLRYAEMEMGKLTVLCGLNNSGKTYVTYAIYGFLHYWNNIFKIQIDSDIMNRLIDSGVCEISVREYADNFSAIIKSACDKYSNQLASVFSAQRNKFANTSFSLDVDSNEIAILAAEYSVDVKSANAKTGLKIYRKPKDDNLTITLFSEKRVIVRLSSFGFLNILSPVFALADFIPPEYSCAIMAISFESTSIENEVFANFFLCAEKTDAN